MLGIFFSSRFLALAAGMVHAIYTCISFWSLFVGSFWLECGEVGVCGGIGTARRWGNTVGTPSFFK